MRISDWSSDVCSSDLEIAGLFHQRIAERADHLAIARFAALDILGDRAAGAGEATAVEPARLEQFPQHRRHAPRAVEALAQICDSGLAVGEQREIVAVNGEVAGGEIDAGGASHSHDLRL